MQHENYTERDSKIGFGLTRKLPRFNDLKLPHIANIGQLEIVKPRGFGAAEIPIFESRSVYGVFGFKRNKRISKIV